jgi:hypothetical protein
MSLTFRSSIPERFVVEHIDEDGRKRRCIAERDENQPGRWNVELTHPDGFRRKETIYCNPVELFAGVGNLLDSTKRQFREAKLRGDRPAYEPGRELSVNVTHGDDIGYKGYRP